MPAFFKENNMELSEVIKNRKSIRKFKDKEIPHDAIEKIVNLARFTPSWKNTQIVRVNIVEDKDVISKIANECNYNFKYNIPTFLNASALCVLSYIKGISGYDKDGSFSTTKEDRWEMFDSGMFAMNFELLCLDEGIGTCTIGYFDEPKLINLLNLGDNVGIGCIIAMGYPDEEPSARPRKEVSELLKYV